MDLISSNMLHIVCNSITAEWALCEIMCNSTVCSTTYLGEHQINHQNFMLLALCKGNSPVSGGFPPRGSSQREMLKVEHWSDCELMEDKHKSLSNGRLWISLGKMNTKYEKKEL